jgi:septal ring factor EnvC (AmiA/AmiB activator)
MTSFISTFITVGICLAIYAYIKRKYSKEIAELERQIADLNLNLVRANSRAKSLDDQLFVKEKEVSNYKSKLDTMADINKELNATKSITKPMTPAESFAPTEAPVKKKRGRKPGYKKPFYKKKSGGSPS